MIPAPGVTGAQGAQTGGQSFLGGFAPPPTQQQQPTIVQQTPNNNFAVFGKKFIVVSIKIQNQICFHTLMKISSQNCL